MKRITIGIVLAMALMFFSACEQKKDDLPGAVGYAPGVVFEVNNLSDKTAEIILTSLNKRYEASFTVEAHSTDKQNWDFLSKSYGMNCDNMVYLTVGVIDSQNGQVKTILEDFLDFIPYDVCKITIDKYGQWCDVEY